MDKIFTAQPVGTYCLPSGITVDVELEWEGPDEARAVLTWRTQPSEADRRYFRRTILPQVLDKVPAPPQEAQRGHGTAV